MWCVSSSACPPEDRERRPALHYVAPRSLLVFDHLTRGIALRPCRLRSRAAVACASEVIRALRGGLPQPASVAGGYSAADCRRYTPRRLSWRGVKRTQEYIAAGDVYQLVLSARFAGRHELDPFQAYRALRLINPSPYMYYCALGDVTVVGSSPEALVKLKGGRGAAAADRRHAAALGRCRDRRRTRSRAARRSEGKCRARHARRSGAQ